MILLIIFGLLVLGMAYYNSVQGFFSATLSAIIAVISAVAAFSLHETVVEYLLGGRMANIAHAMVLLMLFTIFFIVLRSISDQVVPGNVRLPVLADKIGGGVMGLVTAAYGVGIILIALQELPLGPSIVGYTRYATQPDRQIAVQGESVARKQMAGIYDEVDTTTPGSFGNNEHTLYFDDLVVNTVAWLSSQGSLAGSQPLAAIHPDFLGEAFGQRLGMETGGKRVALALNKVQPKDVSVDGVFSMTSAPVLDSEADKFRVQKLEMINSTLTVPADSMLLVVRTTFLHSAADPDGFVRVSCGAVRLLVPPGAATSYTNYFPIGTLQNASTIVANKIDDYLIISDLDGDHAADFVFLVKKDGLLSSDSNATSAHLASGVFIEVKRLARIDLGGMAISGSPTPSPTVAVLRKTGVLPEALTKAVAAAPANPTASVATAPPTPAPSPSPAPAPQPAPQPAPTSLHSPQSIVQSASNGVITVASVGPSDQLPIPVSTGSDAGNLSIQLPGGDCILKNGKFLSLNLDLSDTTVDKLSAGPRPIQQLLAPDGQSIIQVVAKSSDGGWAWAEKADTFALVDDAGNKYAPNGAWSEVTDAGGKKLIARYSANYPLGPITPGTGTCGNVWFSFAVPNGTSVKQLTLGQQVIKDFPPVKAGQ